MIIIAKNSVVKKILFFITLYGINKNFSILLLLPLLSIVTTLFYNSVLISHK